MTDEMDKWQEHLAATEPLPPGGTWIPPENDEAWGGDDYSPSRDAYLAHVRAALDQAAADDPASLPAVLRRFQMVRTADTVEALLRERGVIE